MGMVVRGLTPAPATLFPLAGHLRRPSSGCQAANRSADPTDRADSTSSNLTSGRATPCVVFPEVKCKEPDPLESRSPWWRRLGLSGLWPRAAATNQQADPRDRRKRRPLLRVAARCKPAAH